MLWLYVDQNAVGTAHVGLDQLVADVCVCAVGASMRVLLLLPRLPSVCLFPVWLSLYMLDFMSIPELTQPCRWQYMLQLS